MRPQLLLIGCTGVAAFSEVAPYKQTQYIAGKKHTWELDSEAMLAQSTFPIKPDELIQRTKDIIDYEIGIKRPEDLAEDFAFQFPVVGPLTKSQYLKAVGGFRLTDAFPDYNPGFHNFHVDPVQPNRVWFTSRFKGTNTGDGPPPFGKATDIAVECPPQAISLTFNDQGQVILYTGGYVMDKLEGNSGGMGGIFGPLYAVGKGFPFPEAQPWTPSKRYRLFNWVGGLVQKFTSKSSDDN
jgi:hypothetical protein